MNDEIQDAQVDSSATNLEETQNTPVSQGADSSQADTTQDSSSQQQDANQGAVQGGGLPPKDNLVGEIRRKLLEELSPLIQSTVRDSMLGFQQGQGQGGFNQQASRPQQEEPKYQNYTRSQLEQILRHPDATTEDKMFANRGLGVIEAKEETLNTFRSETEKQQNQSRQQQALHSIVSDYPQVFNKQTGQWNFADPLFQKAMQAYNVDPRLQAFGNEGLRVAVDRAYAQMAREGQLTIKKQQVKLTNQQRAIDKNQSQALSSGTLTPVKQQGAEKSKAAIMEAYKNNPGDASLRNAALGHLIPKSWLSQ